MSCLHAHDRSLVLLSSLREFPHRFSSKRETSVAVQCITGVENLIRDYIHSKYRQHTATRLKAYFNFLITFLYPVATVHASPVLSSCSRPTRDGTRARDTRESSNVRTPNYLLNVSLCVLSRKLICLHVTGQLQTVYTERK